MSRDTILPKIPENAIIIPIIPTLCLMLPHAYYAQNDASIIRPSLSLHDTKRKTTLNHAFAMIAPGCRASVLSQSRSEGRIRGGFQASMLPGLASSQPACSSIMRDQTSDGEAEFVGTPTNFEVSFGSTSTVSDEGRSVHQLGEFSRQYTNSSIISMCKIIVDQTKRIEERLRRVEQKQDELSDTQKEIIHLVNKLRRTPSALKALL